MRQRAIWSVLRDMPPAFSTRRARQGGTPRVGVGWGGVTSHELTQEVKLDSWLPYVACFAFRGRTTSVLRQAADTATMQLHNSVPGPPPLPIGCGSFVTTKIVSFDNPQLGSIDQAAYLGRRPVVLYLVVALVLFLDVVLPILVEVSTCA